MAHGLAFVRILRACRVALFGAPRCRHRWETASTFGVWFGDINARDKNGVPSDRSPDRIDYHQRCVRCGDLTVRRL